jgi:hypothetical protein
MWCIICKENKRRYYFDIQYIDRVLLDGEEFQKIIYRQECNACRIDLEKNLTDYVVLKKIKRHRKEVKDLLIEFDSYGGE